MSESEPIIRNVPEHIAVPEEVQSLVTPAAEQDVPARFGQVYTIPESEFKGDPSRVLGHPSNPWSGHRPEQDS